EPEAVADELIEKGFIRVRVDGRVVNLTDPEPPAPPTLSGPIGVVTDRLRIKGSERHRLVEAIEVAYREGDGTAWVEVAGRLITLTRKLVCGRCGLEVERPTPLSLSFNHPVGACPECKGFGNVLKYDVDKVIPDRTLTLAEGAVEPWTKPAYTWWYEELERHAPDYGIDLDSPFAELTDRERRYVFKGAGDFGGIDGFFDYLESKKYKLHIKVFSSRYKGQVLCKACAGARLKKEALATRLGGLNIAGFCALSIEKALGFFEKLELTGFERELADEALRQVRAKLEFLSATGLGYITLDRLTRTLSGGEIQRVQLATQLASSLAGVLYILDEPSIGLHPVDIDMLIEQIRKLAARGNTVVVVEHDSSVIGASDHIVELGPGSGRRGGRLVWSGATEEFVRSARTLTADYLTGREVIHVPRWRRKGNGRFITISGAAGNNLRDVDVSIPLQTMTCVTGVSGSGKSTLVVDTLYNVAAARFGEKHEKALPCRSVEGLDNLLGVKLVDQGPIGRTPRSNPLTYIGGFDYIRKIFAGLPAARSQGLTPGHFSFNIPGGRCEACRGEGTEKLDMYFLPDVYIRCPECGGRRYRPHILEVRLGGRSVFDVLEMTFEEAAVLFRSEANITRLFSIMMDVGLGYLKLGQSATTLSGGEAQRLKIARELTGGVHGPMLYILDEPTTGLHPDDTKKLLSVLGRLVDSGNTVLLIEHNTDCMKTADWVVDLGPGAGEAGGEVVGAGTPERIARLRKSRTARYLKRALA
ncbi:MAG: excinuclease ABC subunit UvrA, partial [Thermodesulfobacteriota bacterium]